MSLFRSRLRLSRQWTWVRSRHTLYHSGPEQDSSRSFPSPSVPLDPTSYATRVSWTYTPWCCTPRIEVGPPPKDGPLPPSPLPVRLPRPDIYGPLFETPTFFVPSGLAGPRPEEPPVDPTTRVGLSDCTTLGNPKVLPSRETVVGPVFLRSVPLPRFRVSSLPYSSREG